MAICLERGADLHMAQLIHCHSLDGFTLLAPAHPGSPGKRAAKHASSSAVANNIVQKNIIINYLFMMIFWSN